MILRYVIFPSNLNVYPTAVNSFENGFCSVLEPSVILKVSSFGPLCIDSERRTTPPIPTMLFRTELLTAIRIVHFVSFYIVSVLLTIVRIRPFYGVNTTGEIVSKLSNKTSFNKSTI